MRAIVCAIHDIFGTQTSTHGVKRCVWGEQDFFQGIHCDNSEEWRHSRRPPPLDSPPRRLVPVWIRCGWITAVAREEATVRSQDEQGHPPAHPRPVFVALRRAALAATAAVSWQPIERWDWSVSRGTG